MFQKNSKNNRLHKSILSTAILLALSPSAYADTAECKDNGSGVVLCDPDPATNKPNGLDNSLSPAVDTDGNTISTSGNTVTVYDTPSGGLKAVFGAGHRDESVNNNTVIFHKGTTTTILAGASGEDVTDNHLTINGGTVVEDMAAGGYTGGNATGNTVTVNGGNLEANLIGGYAMGGNATNNALIINGGTVKKDLVAGGVSEKDATGNTLTISGGTIESSVYGGYSQAGDATGNTVTIKKGNNGNPIFGTDTRLHGGYDGDTGSANDVKTGNTLNLHTTGLSLGNIKNFENLHFYVPNDANAGDTFLTLKAYEDTDITNTNIGVGIDGSAKPLAVGEEINLIKKEQATLITDDVLENAKGMQGTALVYDFALKKADDKTLVACATGGDVTKCDPKTTQWLDNNGAPLKTAELSDDFKAQGTIDGYDFTEAKTSTDGKTKTFVFTKKPEQFITKWVDSDGNPIKAEQQGTAFGEQGTIDGYDFTRVETSADGKTKTFIFGKVEDAMTLTPATKKPFITQWVDSDGNVIKTEQQGTAFGEQGTIDGYDFKEVKTSTDGKTKTFVFTKKTPAPTITTTFVDENGNELATSMSGANGSQAIAGYDFVKTVTDANGNVKHIYKKQTTPIVIAGKVHPQTKSFLETGLAVTNFVNRGADLAERVAMQQITANHDGITGLGAIAGNSYRSKTGSHIDVDGVNLLVGAGSSLDNTAGQLSAGAYIEGGIGSYDSVIELPDNSTVKADGDTKYVGIGAMAKQQFSNGMFVEGGVRFGKTFADYHSKDISVNGVIDTVTFKTKRNYHGANLGVGYKTSVSDKVSLTPSVKVSYANIADTKKSIGGSNYEFADITSIRGRIGVDADYQLSDTTKLYATASWEKEFKGAANGTIKTATAGVDMPAPTIKGNTGIIGIGATFTPNKNFNISVSAEGSFGKRRGVNGTANMKYEF